MQNAALRWENVGGTGWKGSSNAQRDGQTGKAGVGREPLGTGWGSAVAVLMLMVNLLPAALPQVMSSPKKQLGPLSCLNKDTCQNKEIEM